MSSFSLPRKYLVLFAIAGFILCLDQLTKMLIHTQLMYGDSWPVIKDFFYISHVRNRGAAFGLFREAHETFRTLFFLSMPVIAMGMIIYILRGLPETERTQIFAPSSVFGGALGNYVDRLRFGYVIDFLDFQFHYDLPLLGQGLYTYPAFNVADIAIVSGVGLLLLIMFLQSREAAPQKDITTPASSRVSPSK